MYEILPETFARAPSRITNKLLIFEHLSPLLRGKSTLFVLICNNSLNSRSLAFFPSIPHQRNGR